MMIEEMLKTRGRRERQRQRKIDSLIVMPRLDIIAFSISDALTVLLHLTVLTHTYHVVFPSILDFVIEHLRRRKKTTKRGETEYEKDFRESDCV